MQHGIRLSQDCTHSTHVLCIWFLKIIFSTSVKIVIRWFCHSTAHMFVVLYDVEFGFWVCGESWLTIKDSLTHCPSSQGWASGILLLCCSVCVCVMFCECVFYIGKRWVGGGGGGRRYLSILSSVPFLAGMLCKIIPCNSTYRCTYNNKLYLTFTGLYNLLSTLELVSCSSFAKLHIGPL